MIRAPLADELIAPRTTPRASETEETPTNPSSVTPASNIATDALGWLAGKALGKIVPWLAALVIGLALVLFGVYLLTRDLLANPVAAAAAAAKG